MTMTSSSGETAHFLLEAGRLLTSSLDYYKTLESIAQLAVSELAEWCVIDLVEDGTPRTLVTSHRDPKMQRHSLEWKKKWPQNWSSEYGSPRVMKTGRSEIYNAISEDLLRLAAQDDDHLQALLDLRISSVMIVPIASRQRIFGAITFVSVEGAKSYTSEDLKMAEDLGRQGGIAIENALLYREAKKAQELAEDGKEHFRTLSETLPQLVFTAGPDGMFDYFNSRWEEFCGIPPREEPAFWKHVVHPDHLAEVYERWYASKDTGKMYEQELLIRDKLGGYQWHLARAVPRKDAHGKVSKWFGACTNIDAQKKEETRIAKLHEITSALSRALTPSQIGTLLIKTLHSSFSPSKIILTLNGAEGGEVELSEATFEKNENGLPLISIPLRVNRDSVLPSCQSMRFQKFFFLKNEDEIEKNFPQFFLHETMKVKSMAVVPFNFQGHSQGAVALYFSEKRVLTAEEKNFFLAIVQQASQSLERARLYESELAARHKAEDAHHRLIFLAEASRLLAESLDHKTTLKNIVAHIVPHFADGVCVDLLNEKGEIDRVAAYHRETAKETLLGKISKQYRSKDRVLFNRVMDDGESLYIEHVTPRGLKNLYQDQEVVFTPEVVELGINSAILVRLGSKERALGVMTFLTTEIGRRLSREDMGLAEELGRRATTALESARLYEEARRAVSMRDEFLSIASHELKTPLTSIRLQLQFIKRCKAALENGDKRLLKAFEVFDSQSERLSKLVDNLLDISRIQAGRLSLELETVDLSDLVSQVIDRLPLSPPPKATLTPGILGFWDRSRLDQVVVNLVTNAFKYGNDKSIIVKVIGREGRGILIVQDFGVGIAKEDQHRIFDRFERAVSDRNTWGMGLGLYITRQIVEAHSGTISVQSEPGHGSIFTVELPRRSVTLPIRMPATELQATP